MMRQRWGLDTVLGVSGIAAALIAACSGNDIPPISNDDRDAFEDVYGGDAVGAAGAGMSGGAGAGSGGGSDRGGSGGGGAPVGGSGASGGSGAVGGEPCDAPAVFAASCGSSACHGAGSEIGDFAASATAAEAFVDEPSYFEPGCGLWIDSANPEESLLLTKVNDTYNKQLCGPFRMPQSGDFLEAEDEACILSWLNQFAD